MRTYKHHQHIYDSGERLHNNQILLASGTLEVDHCGKYPYTSEVGVIRILYSTACQTA